MPDFPGDKVWQKTNCRKPAFRKEGMVPVTVALPLDLHDQIIEKAEAFGTEFEAAVATLLRMGLKAQAATDIPHP